MNSQLAILAIVDVEAVQNTGTLIGNCNLIDNNRVRGSSGEGSGQLVTHVEGSQIVNWLVLPADIFNGGSSPYITKIGGEAVDKGIMVPRVFESPEFGSLGIWWGANVTTNHEGLYHYTLTFNVGGKEMDFISSIYAKPAFSNYEPQPETEGLHAANAGQFRIHRSITPQKS